VNWQEALNDASLQTTIAWPAGRSVFLCPLFFPQSLLRFLLHKMTMKLTREALDKLTCDAF